MLFKWSKTICRNNDLVNNQVFSEELAKNWQFLWLDFFGENSICLYIKMESLIFENQGYKFREP
jgi:hypothetical protein